MNKLKHVQWWWKIDKMKKSWNHTLTLTFNYSDPGYDKTIRLDSYEFYGYTLIKSKRVLNLIKPSLRYSRSKVLRFFETPCISISFHFRYMQQNLSRALIFMPTAILAEAYCFSRVTKNLLTYKRCFLWFLCLKILHRTQIR